MSALMVGYARVSTHDQGLVRCEIRRLNAARRISSELVFGRDGPQLLIAPVASEEQVALGKSFATKAHLLEDALGSDVVA